MITHLASLSWGAPNWFLPAAAIGLGFLALIIWCYLTVDLPSMWRWMAVLLKTTAIGLLILCLLEPLLSGVRPRPGANLFAIMIDNSRSMRVDGRGLPADDEMREWLASDEKGWRARLAQDFDTRLYGFDRDLQRLTTRDDVSLDGSQSNLNGALATLKQRIGQRPLAGILLVSDGNATDRWDESSTPSAPVYVVLPATKPSPRDLRLSDVSVSQTLFESSPTTVTANVIANGFAGKAVDVQLVTTKGEGRIVTQATLTINLDKSKQPVRFRFRPEDPDLSFYRLRVKPSDPSQEEATDENNLRTVLVQRGGGPFRILYVAGRPNWEFKFLRRALQFDEEVQLVGLLRIAKKEPKFAFRDQSGTDRNRLFQGFDETAVEEAESYDQPVLVRLGIRDAQELAEGFPATADLLFQYDAVVIDDVEASFFSPDQKSLLRRYVSRRGGGFLMLGGIGTFQQGDYAKTPIGEMLPVYLNRTWEPDTASGPFSLSLTREGMLESWARLRATKQAEDARHRKMPDFQIVSRVGSIKPGATTVATARLSQSPETETPAIVVQRFGKGRTAAVLIGDLWRWAMQRESVENDDLATFWRQLARWLVADVPRRTSLEIDSEHQGVQPVRIQARVLNAEFQPDDNAQVDLAVTPPDGETVQLSAQLASEAGLYVAEYWPDQPGGYRAEAQCEAGDGETLVPATSGWTWTPNEDEFEHLTLARDRLSRLADQTGGRIVSPTEIDSFVESLQNEPAPVTERWVSPIWHQASVLAIALACLCGEWGIRRWKGLA